jgi:hypothetical protein
VENESCSRDINSCPETSCAAHDRGFALFGYAPCADGREDRVAEAVALAWRWFLSLAQRGRDGADFPIALASLAVRAVRSGRRLCCQERSGDVLSPLAQRRRGFAVRSIPDGSALLGNVFDLALWDNRQTPLPEQVCFRLDFPAWLVTRSERDRRLVEDLMLRERTGDVAGKYGLTAGRVSPLRRDFLLDWTRFCGESAEGTRLP